MGFQSFFSSVADVYSKVRSGVSEIYNVGKKIVHGVGSSMSWIDEQLDQLSSIPFIGQEIKMGLDELRDTQIFGISWNRLKRGANKLDEFLDHSEIIGMVNELDTAITSSLEAGESYGGVLDQTFTGGPQVQGGLAF